MAEAPLKKEPIVCLCAGGTGGHLFPALATAKALMEKHVAKQILLFSDKKVEKSEEGADMEAVQMHLPRRSNKKQLPLLVLAMIYTFFKCLYSFMKRRPRLVVGFGGYPSVPPVLAAQLLGIPTLLHEQNAYLGKANRILLKRARHIAISFTPTIHVNEKTPHTATGNPVRFEPCSPYVPHDGKLNILILGGSQGAAIFSTLIPKVLMLLSPEEREVINIIQQCRPELLDVTKRTFDALSVTPVLQPFFENMQDLYEKADLVISRSGASTVSELTVAGRAALFIPYPYAMDQHQLHNVKALGDACFSIEQKDLSPEILAQFLRDCLQNPDMLVIKAQAIQQYSMEGSAHRLAHVIGDLL